MLFCFPGDQWLVPWLCHAHFIFCHLALESLTLFFVCILVVFWSESFPGWSESLPGWPSQPTGCFNWRPTTFHCYCWQLFFKTRKLNMLPNDFCSVLPSLVFFSSIPIPPSLSFSPYVRMQMGKAHFDIFKVVKLTNKCKIIRCFNWKHTSHLQVAMATMQRWRTISSVWRLSWLRFTSCQSSPSSPHSTFHLQKHTFPLFPGIFQSSFCYFVPWTQTNSTHYSPSFPLLEVRHKVIHCEEQESERERENESVKLCLCSVLDLEEKRRHSGAAAVLLHVEAWGDEKLSPVLWPWCF